MKKLFILLIIPILLIACDAENIVSRKYPCRFALYYLYHQDSHIFTAVKSPGTFVYVTTANDTRGIRHVYTYENIKGKAQQTEDIRIENQKENYASYILGADNTIGLFIGCTNFNGSAAYDRMCPNCLDKNVLQFTEKPLIVRCAKCKRSYSLDMAGAIVAGDKGEKLMQYNALIASTLQGDMLQVYN